MPVPCPPSASEAACADRLDGLDFNIESTSPQAVRFSTFGEYVCSLLKHLDRRMGPGLIFSMTPCCDLQSMYAQVQAQCGSNVTMIQPQSRGYGSDSQLKDYGAKEINTYGRDMFGLEKTAWMIDTTHIYDQYGNIRPKPRHTWDLVKQFHKAHPRSPGVLTWNAESSIKCKP